MWRNENQQRPTAGCLSVPLFNQRKRSRLPLTSNPSESEVFPDSHNNEMQPSSSSSSSCSSSSFGPPTFRQGGQWNQRARLSSQQTNMNAAASPGVAERGYAPLPHPKKTASAWSHTGQQRPPSKQDPMRSNRPQVLGGVSNISSAAGQPRCSSGIQSKNQHISNRQTDPSRMPYSPQKCNPTAVSTQGPAALSQSTQWRFRPVGQAGSEMWAKEKKDSSRDQITPQQQKPSNERSQRVLTAVIEGMKHWSQFKDRVPMLFEVFATLDSAVTAGQHGVKKFLMRDGKDVVQCVYFDNDQMLPRLIRGQVHRCVGNYDRQRDLMTCVSVRAASLSEQRNTQEAVRASDTEMRNVVRALTEI